MGGCHLLGRQLQQQRRLALRGQLSCGGSSGEESTELAGEGHRFRVFIWAEVVRSGGALGGGRAESGKGGAGHRSALRCEFIHMNDRF
jgi:hypothetical protein